MAILLSAFSQGNYENLHVNESDNSISSGEAAVGYILLQGHGDEVHFKNIKIKELK